MKQVRKMQDNCIFVQNAQKDVKVMTDLKRASKSVKDLTPSTKVFLLFPKCYDFKWKRFRPIIIFFQIMCNLNYVENSPYAFFEFVAIIQSLTHSLLSAVRHIHVEDNIFQLH